MTDFAPHPFIKPVPPAALEGRVCWACGMAYAGATQVGNDLVESRTFVALKLQSNHDAEAEAVPAGLLLTKREDADRTVYSHRDPYSGRAQMLTLEPNPVLCSDCIRACAQQLGMPPASDAVLNQAAEDRERAETAERRAEKAEQELEELKRGVEIARPLHKMLRLEQAAPDDTPRPPRRARKAAA